MKVTRRMIKDAERIEQEEMELLCAEKRDDRSAAGLRRIRRLRQPFRGWSSDPTYKTRG